MKELIALNLKGKFRWSEYCKPGNHDRKFGPTKIEYLCQIPVIGIVPVAVTFTGIYLAIGAIRLLDGGK